MGFLYRILCGFCLGVSVFAPGVSGSVMAIIMGIYERLLDIVANPFKDFKRNFIYLFPMGIGALISLVLFVLVFSYLFETYEMATYLLFVGLIAGNLPVVFKEANVDGFKKHYLIGVVLAFGIALLLSRLEYILPEAPAGISLVDSLPYLGFCGFIGGLASLVPGMSISLILMLMGAYERLMFAARSIDIPVIAVVGICFVLAMVISSRLIKWVLRRYHNFAYYMVFGFMCGSLAGILMGLPKADGFPWLVGAVMLLLGLGISLLFVSLSNRFNAMEKKANGDTV